MSATATPQQPGVAIEKDLLAAVPEPARGYEVRRRMADITLSTLCLLALLPLCALVASAIIITSPGSVLHRQRRIGRYGRPFMIYTFRTTHLTKRRGSRVTKVGWILRRFGLDDLPQLLNIMRGDMALVGPRPAMPHEIELYTREQRLRLMVTPGATGLGQLSGQLDRSFERLLELDLEYISRRSTLRDAAILLRAVPVVIRGRYIE